MKRIVVASGDARIHPLEAVLGAMARQRVAPGPAAGVESTDAEREREQALEDARTRGHAEGLARAEREVAQAAAAARDAVEAANAAEAERLRAASAAMEALVRQLQAQAAAMDAELEAVAIEAAFAAALRVMGTVPEADRVAGVCRAALDEYRHRPAVLRIAEADAAHVAFLDEGDAGMLRVEADASLAAGECRLQTHKAAYGTSLAGRLDALKEAFLQARASRSAEA